MTNNPNAGGPLHVVAVSGNVGFLSLLQEACETAATPPELTVLMSIDDVDACAMAAGDGSLPAATDIILLDLQSALEASWRCTDKLTACGVASDALIFGLADTREKKQADMIFGSSIIAVLPLPRTGAQAGSLLNLLAATMEECAAAS